MDINEVDACMKRIKGVFVDVKQLIDTLEALLLNNQDDEVNEYVKKIVAYLRSLYKIEKKEYAQEKRAGLGALTKEQRRQMRDLQLIERAVRRLPKDTRQERTIEKLVKDFLASLEAEIGKIEQLR